MQAATHRTLIEFLSANNGQPAVVVMDVRPFAILDI
jgi:hypothetical protein